MNMSQRRRRMYLGSTPSTRRAAICSMTWRSFEISSTSSSRDQNARANVRPRRYLDFNSFNSHFSDYRNMEGKAAYYGRKVMEAAGVWLRRCFAAEDRVIRRGAV